MIVYPGSTEIIRQPDVQHSYRPLDFGQGFYVTTVKEQAMRWARRKSALQKGKAAIVIGMILTLRCEPWMIKS